jgi:hypothetical protein
VPSQHSLFSMQTSPSPLRPAPRQQRNPSAPCSRQAPEQQSASTLHDSLKPLQHIPFVHEPAQHPGYVELHAVPSGVQHAPLLQWSLQHSASPWQRAPWARQHPASRQRLPGPHSAAALVHAVPRGATHFLSAEQESPLQHGFVSHASPMEPHSKHVPFRQEALQHSTSVAHATPRNEQHMPPRQAPLVHSSFWAQRLPRRFVHEPYELKSRWHSRPAQHCVLGLQNEPTSLQRSQKPLWQIPLQQSSERLHANVLQLGRHVPLKHVPPQQRMLESHACPSSAHAVQAPLVQFSLQHSRNEEHGPPPRVHGAARPPVPKGKLPALPPRPPKGKGLKPTASPRSVSLRSALNPLPEVPQPAAKSSAAPTQTHAFQPLIARGRLSRLPRRFDVVYRLGARER